MTFSSAPRAQSYDAIIIGSGPNGFAAAITLARAGLAVLVIEGRRTIGGGMRTEELTLPGFHHDVCSAVHPMASISPFFLGEKLEELGLSWAHPEILLAHPFDDGSAAWMNRDLNLTAAQFPVGDSRAYRKLFSSLTKSGTGLFADMLGPLNPFPRHPFAMAGFGWNARRSAVALAQGLFSTPEARAFLAGNAAHSILPLEKSFTAAIALALVTAGHLAGWPVARGGSQKIADALAARFISLGGEIVTDTWIDNMAALPKARAYLFDTGPHSLTRIAEKELPEAYRKKLLAFRHGPGVFKLDLALSAPIPWKNEACRKAGTVHVGGTMEEIAVAERAPWNGAACEKPFVLVAQQSVPDPTRAPAGQHTCWAYCHVTSGSDEDFSEAIIKQIERFAPGFRESILATHKMTAADFARYNPNYVGGDIIGGVQDIGQLFARPVSAWNPYATPAKDIFLCSSSTPPGGGVHGMCGFHCAKFVLRKRFGAKWH